MECAGTWRAALVPNFHFSIGVHSVHQVLKVSSINLKVDRLFVNYSLNSDWLFEFVPLKNGCLRANLLRNVHTIRMATGNIIYVFHWLNEQNDVWRSRFKCLLCKQHLDKYRRIHVLVLAWLCNANSRFFLIKDLQLKISKAYKISCNPRTKMVWVLHNYIIITSLLCTVHTRMLVSNLLDVYIYSNCVYCVENKSDDQTEWQSETLRKFCECASFVLCSSCVCALD